jgi:hypothetical protein
LLDLAHDPAIYVVRDVERARMARRDGSAGFLGSAFDTDHMTVRA